MTSCSRTSTQTSSPRPHKPLKLATSRGRVPSERHFWNPSPTDRFSFFLTPLVPGLRLAWGARVYCSGIAIPAPGHLVRDEETPQQHQGKTKTRQMHKPTRSAPTCAGFVNFAILAGNSTPCNARPLLSFPAILGNPESPTLEGSAPVPPAARPRTAGHFSHYLHPGLCKQGRYVSEVIPGT